MKKNILHYLIRNPLILPEFDRVNNMIVLSIFVIDEIPKKTEDI